MNTLQALWTLFSVTFWLSAGGSRGDEPLGKNHPVQLECTDGEATVPSHFKRSSLGIATLQGIYRAELNASAQYTVVLHREYVVVRGVY